MNFQEMCTKSANCPCCIFVLWHKASGIAYVVWKLWENISTNVPWISWKTFQTNSNRKKNVFILNKCRSKWNDAFNWLVDIHLSEVHYTSKKNNTIIECAKCIQGVSENVLATISFAYMSNALSPILKMYVIWKGMISWIIHTRATVTLHWHSKIQNVTFLQTTVKLWSVINSIRDLKTVTWA